VVGYLTLMKEDVLQRECALRELLNALQYVVRYGVAWRAIPSDFPGFSKRWRGICVWPWGRRHA
jgi:transposase